MVLLKILSVFFIISVGYTSSSDEVTKDVTQDTELVFAFMVHRHGDRTPVTSSLELLNNSNRTEIEALIEPWGYGQLTNVGRRTAYKVGQFIRRRYNNLIAPKYNRTEMYISSTDSTRTKMSVLTAMAAVYPPVGKTWSDQINWVPTPYTTVPAKYDFNQAIANCPKFRNFFYSQYRQQNSRMDPYRNVIERVSEILHTNLTYTPIVIGAAYDLFVSLMSLGYDVGDDIRAMMPELEAASGTTWDITTGDENYLALEAGVLLNEFFKHASEIMAGNATQTVRVYSAHDANVYAIQAVSRVQRQGVPRYGSLFSLELRRNVKSGKHFVLPVYLADPKEGKEKYLEVKGCGVLCDFDTFYDVTSKYLLDEDTWRKNCGFTEDMVVDTSDID